MSFQQQINTGLFLPTTAAVDAARIAQTDVNSQEFKQLIIQLYQYINSMAIAVNIKDSGYYIQQEFVNGQLFPVTNASMATASSDGRQVFRLLINFGPLPNNSTTSTPHGINTTSLFTFTRIYGAASDPVGLNFIPLPYAAASTSIELKINATNVVITTTSNRSNFTQSWVVVEYLKS